MATEGAAPACPPDAAAGQFSLAPPPTAGGVARGLAVGVRPRQWTKNALVLAAPAAAGVLTQWPAALHVALAFVAFTLVASGTYLLNDVVDADADRRHPVKRHRPLASGAVPAPTAVVSGVLLLAAGLAVAGTVSLALAATAAGYVALSTAYTVWLRGLTVLDIAAVAGCFVVRAVAGGVAADVPLSRWFLIVASFGALFVVVGKRAGEYTELGPARTAVRPTLAVYTLAYLRNLRTLAAGVTLTAYCLWAFGGPAGGSASPFTALSIVPFVLFLMRYALLLEHEGHRSPEELVLSDRGLQLAALGWAALFACGVYVGA